MKIIVSCLVPLLLSLAVACCDSSHDDFQEEVEISNQQANTTNSQSSNVINETASISNHLSGSSSHLICHVQPSTCGGVVQVTPGIRAGSQRFHIGDGFFYHRQRATGGRIYLRCVLQRSNPPCLVRAVMNDDRSNFRITAGVHNHGPDQYFNRVLQLRESLLEACRVRPNVRVELLYHDVCRNVAREVSNRVSLLSIRPSMVRAQSEHRPNIPHSFEELANLLTHNAELHRTLDNEEDIYQGITGQPGHQSVVFLSRRVLLGAGPIQHLFCDGTFYSRPNSPNSCQLLTLLTVRDNHIVPLAYALMESRTEIAYASFLTFLRNLIPTLSPSFIMTDFETALQSSLREIFPRARLTGCLWHYTRAVCRRVRSLGLHQIVSNNEDARRIVRLSMAIPLAPPGRLQEALNIIIIEARRLMLFNEFADFFEYIRTTWINGVGDAILSVFGVRHRTNNVAECHHRNLNSRLVRRPNIWRFLEMLREGEDTTWRDLGRLEEGCAPSRARRVSSIMSDARIRSCSRQIMQGEMQMMQFLSCVSWRLEGTLQNFIQEVPDDRPQSPERQPPPDPPASSLDRPQFLNSNRVNFSPGEHQMDPDFHDQLPSGNNAIAMASTHIANDSRDVDDADLYESLMEERNLDPNVALPVSRGRGRGNRRTRGNRATRGTGAPRSTRPTRGTRGARGTRGTRGNRGTCVTRGSVSSSSNSVHNYAHSPGVSQGDESMNAVNRNQSENVRDTLTTGHPPLTAAVALQNRSSNTGNCNIDLQPENFSEEEESPEGEFRRPWQECLICNSRVGNYAMITCGANPLCGTCIRHWFITMRNDRCLHCGGPVQGWIRLRRQ